MKMFTPTPGMTRYLAALKVHIVDGRPLGQRAIAHTARVSEASVWSWRRRSEFVDWLSSDLQTAFNIPESDDDSHQYEQLMAALSALEVERSAEADAHTPVQVSARDERREMNLARRRRRRREQRKLRRAS